LQHQSGFKVDVVDTTGLGMFSTVRWHSAWRRRCSEEAVRFASAVAALKCTRPEGGRESLTVIKPDLFCHFLYKMPGQWFFEEIS
jgi:sulfofructose kinase